MVALYILATIGAIALLWRAYKALTPKKSHDLPSMLDVEAIESARPELTGAALAAHLGAPLLPGNSVELLVNGDRIFPPMLEAIDGAAETVNFLTFIYWEGAIAVRFADALAAAARRGVEVRVLLDAYGASRMDRALIDRMHDAGCRTARFHPLDPLRLPHYNNRTHRKVLVVDGKIAFTGGVGIAEEWTGDAEDFDHWRDDHFRVTGPVVRYLQGAFAENWRESTKEVLTSPMFYPPLQETGSAEVVPIRSQPGGSVSPIAFTYWLLVRAARERVWITTPYFLPSGDLIDELTEASARGVDVTLLVPGDHTTNHPWIQYGANTYFPALIDAGASVYIYMPTMIHAKVIIADRHWSLIGSPNFDNRSFDLNYESALCVTDTRFNQALTDQFERDLARARRLTADDLDKKGLFERLRNYGALALKPQL